MLCVCPKHPFFKVQRQPVLNLTGTVNSLQCSREPTHMVRAKKVRGIPSLVVTSQMMLTSFMGICQWTLSSLKLKALLSCLLQGYA